MTLPAFAQPAGRWVRANPAPVDVIMTIARAGALGGPAAPPFAALVVVLTTLRADGNPQATFQGLAREAATACDMIVAACGIVGIGAALSIVGAPVAAVIGGIGALAAALRGVLTSLGAGQTPTGAAIGAVATAAAGVSGNSNAQSAAGMVSSWLGNSSNQQEAARMATTTTKTSNVITSGGWFTAQRTSLIKAMVAKKTANTVVLNSGSGVPNDVDFRPMVLAAYAPSGNIMTRAYATLVAGPNRNYDAWTAAQKEYARGQALAKTAAMRWSYEQARAALDDPSTAPTSSTPGVVATSGGAGLGLGLAALIAYKVLF